MVKEAWTAGKLARLTLFIGLVVSVLWAYLVALGTLRFAADTIRNPAIAPAFKVILLVVVFVVVIFLVIFLPGQWLMYALHRLAERRRRPPSPLP
jgi:hypothetical protein